MIIHSFLLVLSLASAFVNSLLKNKVDLGLNNPAEKTVTNEKAFIANLIVNTVSLIMMAYILDETNSLIILRKKNEDKTQAEKENVKLNLVCKAINEPEVEVEDGPSFDEIKVQFIED